MGWRDFWPFGRKAEAQPPATPPAIDCRANGHWVRGELAVCTTDKWHGEPGAPVPVKGHVYRVLSVIEEWKRRDTQFGVPMLAYWLELEGMDGWHYQSNTFRKVVPDHSACDAEFYEMLLNGAPVPEPQS